MNECINALWRFHALLIERDTFVAFSISNSAAGHVATNEILLIDMGYTYPHCNPDHAFYLIPQRLK